MFNINPMEILALLFLSTFVEGFVKYLFDVLTGVTDGGMANGKLEWLKPYTHFLALGLGVALAIAYHVDIPTMFGLTTNHVFVNYIVSGIAIGRGSNYLNDLISSVRRPAAPVVVTGTNITGNNNSNNG